MAQLYGKERQNLASSHCVVYVARVQCNKCRSLWFIPPRSFVLQAPKYERNKEIETKKERKKENFTSFKVQRYVLLGLYVPFETLHNNLHF
jgi:hypothetical protein